MKSIIIVFCVFAATVVLIFANSVYVKNSVDILVSSVDELDANIFEIEKLEAEWNLRKNLLKFSSKLGCIDKIEENFCELKIFAAREDLKSFELSRNILKKRFYDLSRFEQFNFIIA